MATHELKTWPEPFAAIKSGTKMFEFRSDDRRPRFAVGDVLHLREHVPSRLGDGRDTGDALVARVTYVARGPDWGIPEGYCVLSLADVAPDPRAEAS